MNGWREVISSRESPGRRPTRPAARPAPRRRPPPRVAVGAEVVFEVVQHQQHRHPVQHMAAEDRQPVPPAQVGPGRHIQRPGCVAVVAADQQFAADTGGVTAPSRPSRVSGPVRLTRIRPGSRSRIRAVSSAARVVLPVPPIPQTTIPAARRTVSSAGQRRCSARRPTKYHAARGQPLDPRRRPAPAGRPGGADPGPAQPPRARRPGRSRPPIRRARPAGGRAGLGEASSSRWTSRRASASAAITSGARPAGRAGRTGGRTAGWRRCR